MGRKDDESILRVNFEIKGDMAVWGRDMISRGYFVSSSEAVRFALPLLRDHYENMGIHSEQAKKKGED